jgi:transglutaminase-like putative cysteine protease
VTRSRALLILRGVWLGLLVWPYAVAGGMPRPLLLALLPPVLAALAGTGAVRYGLRWLAALLLGLAAVLPTFLPHALRQALLDGGPHAAAVTVTGSLLWLTSLLGWQVFAEATARSRLVWLWLMGTLVLALNRRIWAIGADFPTLGFLALGVLLLAIGGDEEAVPWQAVPLGALPLLGLLVAAIWPQAPMKPLTPPGSVVRGLAGLRVAVSGASLPPEVDVNQSVVLSPAPLLVVHGAPRPAYWQEATFDTFNGVDWLEPPGPRLPAGPGPLPSPLWAPQTQNLPTSIWHVTVQEVLPGSITPLVYTGTPLGLKAEAAAGGSFLPAAHALLLPGTPSYTWELQVPSQPENLLQAATLPKPGAIAAQDLAVPAALRGELLPLARSLAAGGGGPWSLARRIALYLDTHETYNPAFVPSRHGDPIGRFLLRSHQGYCDQFSTAFVMLARLDGLPARWVVGFAPGVWNAAARSETLRAEDAHSWAEVDLAPYGWVQIDPTPGPALAPGQPAARRSAAHAGSRSRPATFWISLVLAALLLLLLVRALRGKLASPARRLHRLERRLGRLARGRCEGRPTWREQVLSLPPPAKEAAWPALEVLEAEHYGKVPPGPADLSAAEAAMTRAGRVMRD